MSQSFQELGVSAPVIRALEAAGITHPFAIQSLVLPDALAGLDVLAESPTGSGKTLAFGLPLVERTAGANARPGALVLVPTRELALQVAADLASARQGQGPARRDRLRRRPDRRARSRRRATRTSSSRRPAGCTT